MPRDTVDIRIRLPRDHPIVVAMGDAKPQPWILFYLGCGLSAAGVLTNAKALSPIPQRAPTQSDVSTTRAKRTSEAPVPSTATHAPDVPVAGQDPAPASLNKFDLDGSALASVLRLGQDGT